MAPGGTCFSSLVGMANIFSGHACVDKGSLYIHLRQENIFPSICWSIIAVPPFNGSTFSACLRLTRVLGLFA